MNIRQIAANSLSARQKSIMRRFMHRIGSYALRDVEMFVDTIVTLDGATTFLQIGANDGYLSDPLNLAIFRHRLRGVFVEPQPHYFAQLQKTYAGFAGLEFLQCAIADTAGVMPLYTLDCSSGRLPRWAHGVGTLSREQLMRFGDQIPDLETYMRVTEVPCMTARELMARGAVRDPDIIVIDAEGYDHRILSQFDFGALTTRLIVFEVDSLSAPDRAACIDQLTRADFALIDAGQDTVAIRRSTRTYRRFATRATVDA